jgi:hypothetical protein
VVVDDFDIPWSSVIPYETYSPLIVDPYRMLPLPVGLQCFEAIAGWDTKIAENPGLIHETKLSQCDVLDIRGQLSASPARPDVLGFGVGEALDHGCV